MQLETRHLLTLSVVASLALAGCNQPDTQAVFDGHSFIANSDMIGDDPRNFSVAVSPVSASLEGAREAGSYEGTRYCIENYGTSRITWTVGPATEAAQLQIVDDTLGFQGRCRPR